jgi:hypothetical protein
MHADAKCFLAVSKALLVVPFDHYQKRHAIDARSSLSGKVYVLHGFRMYRVQRTLADTADKTTLERCLTSCHSCWEGMVY